MDKLIKLAKKVWANDVVERATWTALQAGLTVWALSGWQLDTATVGAVVGAALSAIKTFALNYLKERRS